MIVWIAAPVVESHGPIVCMLLTSGVNSGRALNICWYNFVETEISVSGVLVD